MRFHTDRTAHPTAFGRPDLDHWLEGKIVQTANTSAVQDRLGDPNLYRWVLYRLSYTPLQKKSERDENKHTDKHNQINKQIQK